MRGFSRHATTLAALIAASPALATITVLKDDGSETVSSEAAVIFDPETGGWNVTLLALYNPGEFTVYNVHGDEGDVIDNLLVEVPGATGSPVLVNVISDTEAGISTVRNIEQTGTAQTILSTVNVRADIGSVDVDEIGIMNAGRDVIGPVHARVNASLRGINTIEAQRDILGDITADDGRIVFILSYGRLGTPEHPVTIRAKHDIIQIGSYGGIWGNVTSRHNGGNGRIFAFGATSFEGTLDTTSLFANPFNGWPGRINIIEHFDAIVRIGDSHDDPEQWIELPPQGFAGQIILNADNHPFGTWTSPVYLGPPEDPELVIVGPVYPYSAKSLGGGSIGLAPFALHESSCEPAYGGVMGGGPSATVRLRHYGPVRVTGAPPVTPAIDIERRVLGSGDAWTDVAPDAFDCGVDPVDANTLEVTAGPGRNGFESGFEYRITPTNTLVSDIPAQPPVAWSRSYVIAIDGQACPSDFTGDGVVGMAEMLRILSVWGVCQKCPEDLNMDGIAGFADVLTILGDWGPCP